MAVTVSNDDLMERVCHLTNKIYAEMLCIRRQEGKTYLTMSGIDCWTPHSNPQIVPSWRLLAWISMEGNIPYSFTKFITTPELSGHLYISPGIYHTQITEYSLETIYQ